MKELGPEKERETGLGSEMEVNSYSRPLPGFGDQLAHPAWTSPSFSRIDHHPKTIFFYPPPTTHPMSGPPSFQPRPGSTVKLEPDQKGYVRSEEEGRRHQLVDCALPLPPLQADKDERWREAEKIKRKLEARLRLEDEPKKKVREYDVWTTDEARSHGEEEEVKTVSPFNDDTTRGANTN